MRTRRAAVALSVLAVVIYLIFKYENHIYIAPTITALAMTISILELVYKHWPNGKNDAHGETGTPEQVAAAADWLAGSVAESWRGEAADRRLVRPAPVKVRWEWAGDLSAEEAGRPPVPGTGPRPLPGSGQAGPIPESGVITELHGELYARLPRGRLVITGEAGSGKTGAMILLLLETLDWREKLPPDERLQVPVPVLLTLGGWDPASVPLPAWAASVLNRDYPSLRAARYGGDAASGLIGSGRVALFLDGLDEMAEDARAEALRQLNKGALGLRTVMTSKPAEFAEAARRVPLEGSAVIGLCPVQPGAAADFLLNEQPPGKRAEWRKVTDYINVNPGSEAARALSNPLALTMARDAYSAESRDADSTNDPAVIIESTSWPANDTITGHFIDQFLARYPQDRARSWLGSLARHLGSLGTQDLEWWRLGDMLTPAKRILAVTLATFAAATLIAWIFIVPVALTIRMPAYVGHVTVPFRLGLGLVNGLVDGFLASVLFGSVHAVAIGYAKVTFKPSQVTPRLPGLREMGRALRQRNHASRAASGFLGGLAAGIIFTLLDAAGADLLLGIRFTGAEMLAAMTFFGLPLGLASGIPFTVSSVLEEPSDTGAATTPLSLLERSRARELFGMAVFVPLPTAIVAVGTWMASGLVRGFPHVPVPELSPLYFLLFGGLIGVIGTVSYVLGFTAWGQWLLLARVVLPLTGRLPWTLPGFLRDAHENRVLRQAGAVYQFRHSTLQAYLSE